VGHLVVAEVDGEALGIANDHEPLVCRVGLDVRHHFASHRVLVARRRRENCRISRGCQCRVALEARRGERRRREAVRRLTLPGELAASM
jgi:hypothetical protein